MQVLSLKAKDSYEKKVFLSELVNQILHIRELFSKRLISLVKSCPLCFKSDESIIHLFWECSVLKEYGKK